MRTTIGRLIEEEVRRQGRNITAFADEICCTRTNVYDIFQRSRMDVAQLQMISRVLNHNFFKDLADDPALADATNPEVEKDLMNRRAVAQFFDAMPKVIRNLKLNTNIVVPILPNEDNDPLPNYGLSDYAVFFTVGERLYDRFHDGKGMGLLDVKLDMAPGNHPVDLWHNKLSGQWSVDVKLDYKTEQEWGEILLFIFDRWKPLIKKH